MEVGRDMITTLVLPERLHGTLFTALLNENGFSLVNGVVWKKGLRRHVSMADSRN